VEDLVEHPTSCVDRGQGLWTVENVEVGNILYDVVSPTSCILLAPSNTIVIPDILR